MDRQYIYAQMCVFKRWISEEVNPLQRLLALFFMVFYAPFLFLVLFFVHIEDGYVPIHKSLRIKKGGRPFLMWKIRSMSPLSAKEKVVADGSDERITKMGRFVRHVKADELLQLINIVLGDMVFIGPRPEVLSARHLYGRDYALVLSVKPGLFDISSLVFAKKDMLLYNQGEAGYDEILKIKKQLILFYIQNKSFLMHLFLWGLLLLRGFSQRFFVRALKIFCASFSMPQALSKSALFYASRRRPL